MRSPRLITIMTGGGRSRPPACERERASCLATAVGDHREAPSAADLPSRVGSVPGANQPLRAIMWTWLRGLVQPPSAQLYQASVAAVPSALLGGEPDWDRLNAVERHIADVAARDTHPETAELSGLGQRIGVAQFDFPLSFAKLRYLHRSSRCRSRGGANGRGHVEWPRLVLHREAFDVGNGVVR